MPTNEKSEKSESQSPQRIARAATHAFVKVDDIEVSPLAQREMRQHHVNSLVLHFDPDKLGTISLNHRDGRYFAMDGQHRVEAMRAVGLGDSEVEVDLYEGLTEAQEADMFLQLNHYLAVSAFDKFKVGILAGRPEETAIADIVEQAGLKIAQGQQPGAIGSVTTLRQIHRTYGPDVLSRTLAILRDAYGDSGRIRGLMEGMALVLSRHADVDDTKVVTALMAATRGVVTLSQDARHYKESLGRQLRHCYAAAIVDQVNKGRGGAKLPTWWHTEAPAGLSPLRSARTAA